MNSKTLAPRAQVGLTRRQAMAGLAVPSLAMLSSRTANAALPSSSYAVIARGFQGGVYFIDSNVRCSINPIGRVAFVASQINGLTATNRRAVFHGDGGALTKLAAESIGYTQITAVQISATNEVAIAATRTTSSTQWRGIYRLYSWIRRFPAYSPTSTLYGASAPIDSYQFYSLGQTLYEGDSFITNGSGPTPAQRRLEMSTDGSTLVFSSLVNGKGGIYRSSFTGLPTLAQRGSGTFFNNVGLGVAGPSGAVAAEMEYGDPYRGLTRGALVFPAPALGVADVQSTIERGGIGLKIELALNSSGQMAFAINSDVTVPYFSVPTGGGVETSTITLRAGVHVATPTPFGTPFTYRTVALASHGYSNFGEVAINDAGQVVFAANDGQGRAGVFYGSDPVAHAVAVTFEYQVLAGQLHFFSFVRLGGLNNAGQVAFVTTSYGSADQHVWRAQL
jgi:hypothetical protein